jgi:hypothetical protein
MVLFIRSHSDIMGEQFLKTHYYFFFRQPYVVISSFICHGSWISPASSLCNHFLFWLHLLGKTKCNLYEFSVIELWGKI